MRDCHVHVGLDLLKEFAYVTHMQPQSTLRPTPVTALLYMFSKLSLLSFFVLSRSLLWRASSGTAVLVHVGRVGGTPTNLIINEEKNCVQAFSVVSFLRNRGIFMSDSYALTGYCYVM